MGPNAHTTQTPVATLSERAIREQISSELDALERGDLRSEAQVQTLQRLLGEVTGEAADELKQRADDLHVRMLADENVNPLRELPLLGIVID